MLTLSRTCISVCALCQQAGLLGHLCSAVSNVIVVYQHFIFSQDEIILQVDLLHTILPCNIITLSPSLPLSPLSSKSLALLSPPPSTRQPTYVACHRLVIGRMYITQHVLCVCSSHTYRVYVCGYTTHNYLVVKAMFYQKLRSLCCPSIFEFLTFQLGVH